MGIKQTRIGVVGCGAISHLHAKGIGSYDELSIVACADINEEMVRLWAEKYNIEQWFTDWTEMVVEVRPDIVLFATWPSQHHEQVTTAARLGVPAILCEKSFSLTGKESREMAQACADGGALAMEGMMYRHTPCTREFLRMVDDGEIGELRYVHSAFSFLGYDPQSTNWRNRKETGGGIVFDFTSYPVNILRALFGRSPQRVVATGEICPVQDIIVTLNAMLDYGDGRVGHIESSQKVCFRMETTAVGTNGWLNFPLFLLQSDQHAPPPHSSHHGQFLCHSAQRSIHPRGLRRPLRFAGPQHGARP